MKPRVSILSPDFKYVPAVCTDVARTIARVRREQRERAAQQRPADSKDFWIVQRALGKPRGTRDYL